MGDFLTAVDTVSLRPKIQKEDVVIRESSKREPPAQIKPAPIQSSEDALNTLRARPDVENLEIVLNFLARQHEVTSGFHIKIPSPSSAKIINELVSTTIPDFWDSVKETRPRITECLQSVSGVAAVLARLRLLAAQYQPSKQASQTSNAIRPVAELVSVLSLLLSTDSFAHKVWKDIETLVEDKGKRVLLWKEFLTSIASGKVVSTVAQAEDIIRVTKIDGDCTWLSDGSKYTAWLGRNVATMAREGSNQEDDSCMKAAAQLCSRSFTIGYAARVVETIIHNLFLSTSSQTVQGTNLIKNLQAHEQKQFLELTMRYIGKAKSFDNQRHLMSGQNAVDMPQNIAGGAALVTDITSNNPRMKDYLEAWLSDPALNVIEPFPVRRVAVVALSAMDHDDGESMEDRMQAIVEKNMKMFGDPLFIKHSPMIQQESCAEVLLLAAGYVHRTEPMSLFLTARSSAHLNAVSNRLKTSSPRARFLGMVTAMAVSELVDKPGSKMTFDTSNMKTPEAKWYQNLVNINDKVGNHSDAIHLFAPPKQADSKANSSSMPARMAIRSRHQNKPTERIENKHSLVQTEVQGPKIMELSDDSEDDDLVPYANPDSDPEDDDEDPTLVTRNKPKPPVYIRDLISGLHDTENYDRHTLALKNAGSLIRRKSSFGKEVQDHATELASILTSLSDHFELEDFQELRLQALIALLLSNSVQMAPWFARQVFDGDYSLAQRGTVLSVLGLGARELAGYKDEDEELNPALPSTSFPSRKLPDRLHKIYGGDQLAAPVSRIASSLSRSMIEPTALKAADKMSGPNILKVRTFSSRMEVEKKRSKAIPNALAKPVAEYFFFPLTGRWWQNMQAYGANNVHFQPFLLSTYLKTLAILLHAAGVGALALPQMTSEFWDLLLSVRTNALGDVSVLEAVLFCFLTLLEVNEDKRRIAEDHSKQLVETQEWVELVFSKSSGGDEEGERTRMLAASVLMKTREVVDKYQRSLVGEFMDY